MKPAIFGGNTPPLPAGVSIRVYESGTATLATVYDFDSGLAIDQIALPFVADADGRFAFTTDPAQMIDVQLGGEGSAADLLFNGGAPRWYKNNVMLDPAEFGAASAAAISADEAAASATSASGSATTATTKADEAAASATSASGSATTATTKATEATTSKDAAQAAQVAAELAQTNAESESFNAFVSANSAGESASTATLKAAEAADSAFLAASSELNADVYKTQTQTIYNNFDARYLGAKASAPTLDNAGNALLVGTLYFDTAMNVMRVWNGTEWVSFGA